MKDAFETSDLDFVRRLGYKPTGYRVCPVSNDGTIHPNVTQFLLEDTKTVSVFHIKPIYYENRNGQWRPLSEITSYHGNKNIILNDNWRLAHPRFIDWLTKRQALFGKTLLLPTPFGPMSAKYQPLIRPEINIGLTVTTVYPNPNPETTTVDGQLLGYVAGSGHTWAETRDRTDCGAGSVDDSGTTSRIRSAWYLNNSYVIDRFIALFNTSAIGTDEISAATISVCLNQATVTNNDNDGEDFLAVTTSSPASNTALVTGDWDQTGGTSPVEQHATSERIDYTGLVSGYLDFDFNSTGIGNIAKTGISKFAFREGHDMLNSPYAQVTGDGNFIIVRTADYSGTTSDPKLVVTHAPASGYRFNPQIRPFAGL